MKQIALGVLAGAAVIGLVALFYSRPAQSRLVATYEAFVPMVTPVIPVDLEADAVAYCRPRVGKSDRIERPNAAALQAPSDEFAACCNIWLQYRYVRIKDGLFSHSSLISPLGRETAHKRLADAYNSAGSYLRATLTVWPKRDGPSWRRRPKSSPV